MLISQGIFSFGQFITGLALLIVLFTITDIRFKFRIAISVTRLRTATYVAIGGIGLSTLATDLWHREPWPSLPVPSYWFSIWEAVLGGIFLLMPLVWMYYGYIRPPRFGSRRARRFGQQLYTVLLKGNDAEIAIIADELALSAHNLIKLWIPEVIVAHGKEKWTTRKKRRKLAAAANAHNILLLMADPRMCRQIVKSCPRTALLFAMEVSEQKRYGAPISEFLRNVSQIAITDETSPIYHEGDNFARDYIGQVKPWTKAIYGDFKLVEEMGKSGFSPLDVDYRTRQRWTSRQWHGYSVAVLTTIDSFLVATNGTQHSFSLARAFGEFESCIIDLYKLNGVSDDLIEREEYRRLNVVVEFIKEVIRLTEDRQIPRPASWRANPRYSRGVPGWSIYDYMADLMYQTVKSAIAVRGPLDTVHLIFYNSIWGEFFGIGTESRSWGIVQGKLQKILLAEVRSINKLPNYQNVAIIGFLLNVIWSEIIKSTTGSFGREYRGLARVVSGWMKKNYLDFRAREPELAEYMLFGSIEFDEATKRIGKRFLNNKTGPIQGPWLQL